MRKIGENTAYVRFDAKANRSQITWEKLRGGGGEIGKVIKRKMMVKTVDCLQDYGFVSMYGTPATIRNVGIC